MELGSIKKSRRNSMMCSKSFETQKVGEISPKKARESRNFFILWMGIIEGVFQMEGKIENEHEKIFVSTKNVL